MRKNHSKIVCIKLVYLPYLTIKFRKNKSYHVKRTAHTCHVISLLLKPITQRLIDVTFVQSFEIALFSIRSVQTYR